MALNQDPDRRASCRMCLTTNQVNKARPDIVNDDGLDRPIPPNRRGPLRDSLADPNQKDTGSVIIPPSCKPQTPPGASGGKLLESLITDIRP